MPTEVLMPQMGESIAEGTITRWLASIGTRVERDQPLVEISTDKVDAEVPSPASGVLLEIRHQEGETVAIDSIIALIGEADEAAVASQAGAVNGALAAGELAGERSVPAIAVAAEATDVGPSEVPAERTGGELISLEERLRTFSSPLVRSIASKEGVNLRHVRGTGSHGRVTKSDILAYLEHRGEAGKAPQTVPEPAPVSPDEAVRIEPMSRIRQLTAAHMLHSQQVSAHVATVFDADLSGVVAARALAQRRFAERAGTKLTYMPFFFRAVVSALQLYPKFNASLDGTNIVYKQAINLGMAVSFDRGLIVPVIQHADQLNLVGLAQRANDLAERARAHKLKPEEIAGGTFTLTNPGVFGSLFGTPLIHQPQVAILCIGTIEKRVVVTTDAHGNDSLAIRPMAYLCLSYDHRLIDGADAELFMVEVKRVLREETWSELEAYRG